MVAKLGDFLIDINTSVNSKGITSLAKSLGSLTFGALKFATVLGGATLAAGVGLTKFAINVVDETAELGRLAKDLGTTTNFLETFTRSFERMGAGGDEAISTIKSLKKEIEAFKVGQGRPEAFGILGINIQDLGDDVGKNFDLIRRRFNGLTAAQRLYFVDQIGLGEKTVRMLRLTDKEYKNLLKSSSKIPLATTEQINNSEIAKQSFVELSQTYGAVKRKLVSGATPAITKFSSELIKILNDPKIQANMALTMNKLFEVLPKLIEVLPRLADAIIRLADILLPEQIDKEKRIEGKSYFMDKFQKFSNSMQDKGYFVKRVITNEGTTTMLGGKTTYVPKKFVDKDGLIQNNRQAGQTTYITKDGLTQEDIDRHIAKNGNNVTRIIESSKPSNSVSQTFNISIPIQNSGGDLNADKAKEFGRIIKDALDQEMKMSSENFKSGSIQ
jgi:predicted SpoU family rRNA methylase